MGQTSDIIDVYNEIWASIYPKLIGVKNYEISTLGRRII